MAIFVTKWILAKPSSVPVNLCQEDRTPNFSWSIEFQEYVKLTALQTSNFFGGLDSLTLCDAYWSNTTEEQKAQEIWQNMKTIFLS